MTAAPRVAVIVVSDRCARGAATDTSGPAAAALLRAAGYDVAPVVVVPDGAARVEAALRRALTDGARVVVTSGGTGVGPRDRTPEGTAPLLALDLPGLAEAIRRRGAETHATAALSRGRTGLTEDGAVLVNLPGSPGAVADGVDVLLGVLPHLLDQLHGGDH